MNRKLIDKLVCEFEQYINKLPESKLKELELGFKISLNQAVGHEAGGTGDFRRQFNLGNFINEPRHIDVAKAKESMKRRLSGGI